MELIFVRHGQTDLNLKKVYQGKINVSLNQNGINEAIEIKNKLKNIKINKVYTSPLNRTIQTMNIILENREDIPIKTDSRIEEIDFGDWDTISYDKVMIGYEKEYENFLNDYESFTFPNGESFNNFYNRCANFLDDIIDVESKDNKGKNYEEIKVVHEELDEFIKFAQKNKKSDGSKWSVGILSFYLGQIKSIREVLQNKFKTKSQSRFVKDNVEIKLSTVDRFQGDEKDIIFLSMVRTDRDGFLDSPYRLNVAITRARYQLVVIGKRSYFKDQSKTPLLNKFAKQDYGHKERFYK